MMNNDVISNCLVCGSNDLKLLKKYEKDHLVRCRKCSFVFSRLRPTEDELNRTYAAYKRGISAPTSISIEKLRARAKWICDQANVGTVLDVGCGDGYFLRVFSEMGCKIYGTEFDRESEIIAEDKGAIMLEGGLMPPLPENITGFDLIIFTEVIEHINNPKIVLNHFQSLLNPNGLLFITTPNFDGLERYMLGPKWGMIMYPEHISYYSPATLDDIVISQRLHKVRTYTENISLFRIIEFINRSRKAQSINAEKVAAKAQEIVSGNKMINLLKKFINGVLNLTGKGSSIVALYQKR